MINQIWMNYREKILPLIRCLLIGFLGGPLLFIIIGFQQLFWIPFAYTVEYFRGMQGIGSFILGFFILGGVSFRVVNEGSKNVIPAIFRGCLTGLSSGLAFLTCLIIFYRYYPRTADTFFLLTSVLFEILAIPLILGGMGAYFLYILELQRKILSSLIPKPPVWLDNRTIQVIFGFVIILAYTILPPLIVYFGKRAGMI